MKIGIIGLGYVGLPLACLFAKKYPTVGYDPYKVRVESLNTGVDTTGEISSETLKERLATTSFVLQTLLMPPIAMCISWLSLPLSTSISNPTLPHSAKQVQQ
jgi:VI polysaccharide biosynthesis protein vipA/tviB